jgi:PST family polysaccharide transporter
VLATEPPTPRPDESLPSAHHVARGSVITIGGQAARFAVQAASLVVLSRLLSVSDYGIVAMVTSIVGIATILGDFGLSMAAIQARHITNSQRSALLLLNTSLGACLTVIVFALAVPIADFYNRPEVVGVVRALSFTFLIDCAATQFKAELGRRFAFKQLAIVDVVSNLGAFALAVVLGVFGAGYWALVAQQLGIAGIALIGVVAFSRWMPRWPERGTPLRSLLSFGGNTLGVQAITYVSSNIDNVLVGKFLGPIQLGYYSRAYLLLDLPVQQLASPLTRVALPTLSRIDDDKTFVRYVERAQLVLGYLLCGIFALAASVAQPLITFLLGPNWGPTASVFQVLAIGGGFTALGYVYYWIFLAKGKTKEQLRYSLFTRCFMILAIFIGAHHSAVGAATGVAIGLAANWAVLSFDGLRRIGVPHGRLNLLTIRALICNAAIAVIVQLNYHAWFHHVPTLGALAIGALLYLFLLGLTYLLLPRVREDLNAVRDTVALALRRRHASVVEPVSASAANTVVTDETQTR